MNETASQSLFNTIATGLLVACAVIVTVVVVWQQFFTPAPEALPQQPQTRELSEEEWARAVGETATNPAVTIVEFFDFQCPFCKQGLPALSHVVETFGEDVQVIRRHLPLKEIHPAAIPAAIAAECAREQGKFDAYHAMLFANQDSLSAEQSLYEGFADELGIEDIDAFADCVTDQEPLSRIQADAALAKDLQISSTPTLVINGTVFPGAPSPEALETIVGSMIEN